MESNLDFHTISIYQRVGKFVFIMSLIRFDYDKYVTDTYSTTQITIVNYISLDTKLKIVIGF